MKTKVSNYLITGISGTGKTSVAMELRKRGYVAVNTDDLETGISHYLDTKTGQYIERPTPPFDKDWLKRFIWVWDPTKLQEALVNKNEEDVFICGSSNNEADFYHLFDKVFGLVVDSKEITRRLQIREPERWADGSADLERKLKNNQYELDRLKQAKATIINASHSIREVVDEILSHIKHQ